MSDTPRTDATRRHDLIGHVPVYFARELERDLAKATAERNEAQKALASLQEKLLEFINDKEWLDRTFHEKVSIGRWDAASKIEDILIAFKKEVQNG
jgi:hypothetical protein